MARFVINGQRRLSGTYHPSGNKNAILPMLAASVLTDEPVVLDNIPLINDVRTMLEILSVLGVDVSLDGHMVTLRASGLKRRRLDSALCRKVRSSILFAGPLAARLGRVTLSPPGGDIIGRRRVDTHFAGLRALGIEVSGGTDYVLRRRTLRGTSMVLDEASVTATENILMAATLAEGETTIFNAACEPHVQDLCRMLTLMGADIKGIGTNRLVVTGVNKLHGVRYRVQPDLIEIGSFLAAAAVTGGEVTIPDVCTEETAIIAPHFRKLGMSWVTEGTSIRNNVRRKLRVKKDFGAALPKIEDGPWPSFPSDLMSVALVTATQTSGSVLFFEKMFESRMYFVDQLIAMGANIVQCDPHRVIVSGATRLHGTPIASPDIRAGMALLIAALAAKGTSTIENIQVIDRGYETVETKLQALGADITREE